MDWSKIKPIIVYSSPAGTTEKTAQFISQSLKKVQKSPEFFNLSAVTDYSVIYDFVKNSLERVLLFVGSPVYVGHPVPPVLEFLEQLPVVQNNLAVPFVTWGAVSSGVALREMADILNDKQFGVCGAASILAEHSQMWSVEEPLAENRPAEAINYTPYPEFQKNCICCFNCVRICPEDALKVPTEKMATMLRNKAKESPESKKSRIFLPE
jgi:NAD-dependent dihydropyrimidine dehydrogenase PreA subunit